MGSFSDRYIASGIKDGVGVDFAVIGKIKPGIAALACPDVALQKIGPFGWGKQTKRGPDAGIDLKKAAVFQRRIIGRGGLHEIKTV